MVLKDALCAIFFSATTFLPLIIASPKPSRKLYKRDTLYKRAGQSYWVHQARAAAHDHQSNITVEIGLKPNNPAVPELDIPLVLCSHMVKLRGPGHHATATELNCVDTRGAPPFTVGPPGPIVFHAKLVQDPDAYGPHVIFGQVS
ncbi:MAG: hypothetical protein Q9198_011133, partial [Flavoplaca austrocitrina]